MLVEAVGVPPPQYTPLDDDEPIEDGARNRSDRGEDEL